MRRTDTIVIGAGQAGLAVSRCLSDAGRDHVVLERGRVGESWRRERRPTLRLLTPNWFVRLPGFAYDGADPDGFMATGEYLDVLDRYRSSFDAPVEEQTPVESVSWDGERYTVRTGAGSWSASAVVVATGHCMHPRIPGLAAKLPASVHQITARDQRSPDDLPPGGVLVVGASSSGVQAAEELAAAGRDVVLAVGNHSRVPRMYRGRDIFWWLDRTGMLDDRIDAHARPDLAASAPSMQLVGSAERRDLDLATCRAAGVRLAGRVEAVAGSRVFFAPSLEASIARAQERMHRTLDRIDGCIEQLGLPAAPIGGRPAPVQPDAVLTDVDLEAAGIRTVVWATGFVRRYPWLPAAALDPRGEIRHRNGIGAMPGMYVVGLRFQQHRSSNFIGGVGRDAADVVDHLTKRPTSTEPVFA